MKSLRKLAVDGICRVILRGYIDLGEVDLISVGESWSHSHLVGLHVRLEQNELVVVSNYVWLLGYNWGGFNVGRRNIYFVISTVRFWASFGSNENHIPGSIFPLVVFPLVHLNISNHELLLGSR